MICFGEVINLYNGIKEILQSLFTKLSAKSQNNRFDIIAFMRKMITATFVTLDGVI